MKRLNCLDGNLTLFMKKFLFLVLFISNNGVNAQYYPDGPPTCGSKHDPGCNPWWTSWHQTPTYIIFIPFLIAITFISGWYSCVKLPAEKEFRSRVNAKVPKDDRAISYGKVKITLEPVKHIVGMGYKDCTTGTIGWLSYCFLIFQMCGLIVLTLINKYWGCQFGHINRLCWYGSYPLTGKKNEMSDHFDLYVVFCLWWYCVFFSIIIIWTKDQVGNFFRLQTKLRQAKFISIKSQIETEIYCTDPNIFVQYGRKAVKYLKKILGASEVEYYTETVPICSFDLDGIIYNYIEFQCERYIITPDNFIRRIQIAKPYNLDPEPLDEKNAQILLQIFGKNNIQFEAESIGTLCRKHFLTPIHLYELAIYLLWWSNGFIVFGFIQYAIIAVGYFYMALNELQSQKNIEALSKFSCEVKVKRGTDHRIEWISINSQDIVPGDLVQIESDWKVPGCDIALIKGICVCDESSLTGEAYPVGKQPCINNEIKSYNKLLAGTKVLQAGTKSTDEVYGIVLETGIHTQRGKLVRGIISPVEMVLKFDEEFACVFIILMMQGVLFATLAISWHSLAKSNTHWILTFFRGLYLIGNIFPPLTGLALSLGFIAAHGRLFAEHGINCVNPKRICIAGKVSIAAFDKTGTMTEDGIAFLEAHSTNSKEIEKFDSENVHPDIVEGMATCHSLALFNDGVIGHEVEKSMFEATNWTLEERNNDLPILHSQRGDSIELLKRFDFDHNLMRMSVIAQNLQNKEMSVYCKGAAERIFELCEPQSLPKEIGKIAEYFAAQGCYVLALATKKMKSFDSNVTRDEIESKGSFKFLTLLLFRNNIRSDTKLALKKLYDGGIRNIMVTGDNAQCAYYVAKASDMFPPFAPIYLGQWNSNENKIFWKQLDNGEQEILLEDVPKEGELIVTGDILEHLSIDLVKRIRCFARVLPQQKRDIIQMLMDEGFIVSMCGDGGNDSGALKAAHVGLALSEAEASLVSPFTTSNKTIMQMFELICSGRCALTTSFGAYKFIIGYGQTYGFTKLIANWFDVLLSVPGYFFIDVVGIIGILGGLALSRPRDELSVQRPTGSLFNIETIISVIFPHAIFCVALLLGISYGLTYDGYQPWARNCHDGSSWFLLSDNWEATMLEIIFNFSIFSFAVMAGMGFRFRKSILKNGFLTCVLVLCFASFSWLILSDANFITDSFSFAQRNLNRKKTTSVVWQAYQNRDVNGLPKYNSPECKKMATSFDPDQIYKTGVHSDYDECVHKVCTDKYYGCECGFKDGKAADLSNDNYGMGLGVRAFIWFISVFACILSVMAIKFIVHWSIVPLVEAAKENYRRSQNFHL